ncbi:MAG: hypothetical protein K1X57_03350 [Gemmataceae bacterium]|nr:hypothetical protein [Gemmataceae bacterium]
MEHDLPGYLLELDEELDRDQFERELAANHRLMESLARFKMINDQLDGLNIEFDPPSGLADRTLARIRLIDEPIRPSARLAWEAGAAPSRRRWEAAAALAMCLVFGSLVVLGIDQLSHRAAKVACTDNLRGFHQALAQYATDRQGYYPELRLDRGRPRAGTFFAALSEAGYLAPNVSPSCNAVHAPRPVNGRPATFELDYCYTLGWRDAAGLLRSPRRAVEEANDLTAALADRPPNSWVWRHSAGNHPGGANVLYLGGHVIFVISPNVGWGGDHIFENDDHRVAAGKHARDSALGTKDDVP